MMSRVMAKYSDNEDPLTSFLYAPNFTDYCALPGDIAMICQVINCDIYPNRESVMHGTATTPVVMRYTWIEEKSGQSPHGHEGLSWAQFEVIPWPPKQIPEDFTASTIAPMLEKIAPNATFRVNRRLLRELLIVGISEEQKKAFEQQLAGFTEFEDISARCLCCAPSPDRDGEERLINMEELFKLIKSIWNVSEERSFQDLELREVDNVWVNDTTCVLHVRPAYLVSRVVGYGSSHSYVEIPRAYTKSLHQTGTCSCTWASALKIVLRPLSLWKEWPKIKLLLAGHRKNPESNLHRLPSSLITVIAKFLIYC